MDTLKINKKNTKMVAHRGLSGIEPENSALAFLAAANRSYCGIETDVHKTRDGKFILTHDDETGRVAPKNLHVEETDFDVLRKITLNGTEYCPATFPTLTEYLAILKRYGKIGVLEFKNAFQKEDVAKILDIIKKEDMAGQMIFISFCLKNLLYIKELENKAQMQFLMSEFPDNATINKLKEENIGIDINYNALNAENVALLKKNGIEINCWTVNDIKAAENLASYGVDYITSNILE